MPQEKTQEMQLKLIAMGLVIGLIGYGIGLLVFNDIQARLIGLIAFLVTMWTNEGLPIGVVSLLPIILFPSLDIISINATAPNYSNPIIYLFLGGFILAVATEKIHLHEFISSKILNVFPSTPRGIIFSLATTAAVLSSFLSNTTTALLLIPIASFLTSDTQLKIRFILAIAYGASIGGIVTPIGTPPNMILLGFMQKEAMELIPFVKWIMLTIPLASMMLVVSCFVLTFGLKFSQNIREIDTTKVISSDQKRLLWILGGLVLLLLVNSPIKPYYNGLGIHESVILLGFGLVMFFPKIGFLKWEDTKKVPYEIMFLFGAGFSIARAFSDTGLASSIASYLMAISDFSPLLLILCVAALITFTTEITSNTALISIALPIIFALGKMADIQIELLMMVATICASYAFMLPIATPPNAVAMSTGVVNTFTMMRFGLVLNLLAIGLTTFIALSYWQYFL
ncbi:SLC13 family permease [Sulfurospirillum tamanense]|nr:SLC13 family permease [Sulfurospirillum tamanensis]